jgi:ATP-dependent helicase HrpB
MAGSIVNSDRMALEPLPIDASIPLIVAEVSRARAAVIVAAPGAGKTTRVPPALLEAGRTVVLQPRRVAARAIAARIAAERGWQVGREVGWHVRFDRRFGPGTRLLIATEGMLTARLQSDPLLSEFRTVVIDEFHERSIHADLAIALAKQAWLARSDLRLVVMSATLDPAPVAAFLRGCAVIEIPGRPHAVEVSYAPRLSLADAVTAAAGRTEGDVLCFLPGAPEIARALPHVRDAFDNRAEVLPLHGSLEAQEQDRVFEPGTRRRVVLATNIAETSITVPRITAVVDSGLQKVARYDAARAVDSLDLERVTQDSADQRAGRAGRLSPGVALRLWDVRDRLRPQREPEIARIDLSSALLEILAWGGDPRTFDWFERPDEDAVAAGLSWLARIQAVSGDRITELGRELMRLPLHPRLGRLLLEAGGAWHAAVACAVIAERAFLPERAATTSCDLLPAIDDFERLPAHVRSVARQVHGIARAICGDSARSVLGEVELRRAILAGYPDRVAQRRASGSSRLLLATGTGAVLSAESGVIGGEFMVALDVHATPAPRATSAAAEARVRMASRIEREWLEPTHTVTETRIDEGTGTVRAFAIDRYDAFVLVERPVPVDTELAASMLAARYIARGPSAGDERLLRRLAFAGHPMNFDELVRSAARGARRLADIRLHDVLPRDVLGALDRLAPERLLVPSGRAVPLDYREDGTVSASVKLQELFGLAETPRVGPGRVPVLLLLLAPNGRPVQTTRDLRSFWERTYPEVRKELRGRYPRHPWPEDPWTARPGRRNPRTRGGR